MRDASSPEPQGRFAGNERYAGPDYLIGSEPNEWLGDHAVARRPATLSQREAGVP